MSKKWDREIRETTRGIARAWDHGPAPGLAARIGARCLWPEVARRTAEAYDQVAKKVPSAEQ